MAVDVNIRANDIFITGMRYTAGSDKITLVYQENGKNLSEEVPLSDVKMDYTVSNQQYLDPTDVVWSSTDASVVKVENGAIVFGENITGAKQVTITVTNKDKTVMDSFLVVVSGASAPGGREGLRLFGCGFRRAARSPRQPFCGRRSPSCAGLSGAESARLVRQANCENKKSINNAVCVQFNGGKNNEKMDSCALCLSVACDGDIQLARLLGRDGSERS